MSEKPTYAELEAQLEQYDAIFDLQHVRDMEACRRWQAEDPRGRERRFPDRGSLLDYLWAELIQAEAALEQERRRAEENAVMLRELFAMDERWNNTDWSDGKEYSRLYVAIRDRFKELNPDTSEAKGDTDA